MKRMNLVNVMNEIESENATMALLLDPQAEWNITNSIDIRNSYDYHATGVEMENDSTWDFIEHCEKWGWDYDEDNWRIKDIMPFEEWFKVWKSEASKYMVS